MASKSESLPILKELFPDWSEEDLSICLEESRGELDTTIARISEGHATKFGEVTKKKEKAPKRVEYGNGRGRGRGASTGAPRGRSEFRGRGRGRGASTSAVPSGRPALETTPSWAENAETATTQTETQPAWDTDDAAPSTAAANVDETTQKSQSKPSEQTSAPAQSNGLFSAPPKAKTRIIDKNSTSSWASIAKPAAPAQRPQESQKPTVARDTTGQTKATDASIDHKPAPLTEENLEVATQDQKDIPQPPTATVASLQGEPATGPSSLSGVQSSAGPPGLKTGQSSTSARVSTPVGGRRLNQNEAVVMPGSESHPAARLGVQFGSLGLGDDEAYNQRPEVQSVGANQQKQDPAEPAQAPHHDKANESYGGFGTQQGVPSSQQPQPQHQQPTYGGQGQEQYPGMSSFYGHNEPARASPFGGQADYYQQQQGLHSQHTPQPPYGSQLGSSQRSDTNSRPTEQSSRFGEPASSPMTSMTSQPNHSASPVPSHLGGQQQQQQHQSQYPMHPQYGAPNPYAYYGYGYGYPQHQQQQQHSGYGGQMYGQQQRGGYGGPGQYQSPPVNHQPVGTSQDRFERSTAEYQRQQQMHQYPQSGFGNTDFLGGSRNHQQQSSEALDPFKGYGSTGSTGSRDDAAAKSGPSGYGGQSTTGYGQQTPSAGQYGSHSTGQYGSEQPQQHQQQQPQQQQQQQSQFSQYGSYGRQGGHQQYGGQWNQY